VSFHSWQIIGERVVPSPVAEMLNGAPDAGANEREPRWQKQRRDASINIELKSINASIRVVVSDTPQTTSAQSETAKGLLRLKGAGKASEAMLDFPDRADKEAAGASSARLDQDPLVVRLSEALAAAEKDQSEFGGIYADAIRLATVARMLSIHSGSEPFDYQPQNTSAPGLSKWRLKLVMKYVAEHIGDKVTLADMAAAARLSRMHFAALFLRATGMRPHDYLLKQRVAVAQELLQSTEKTIVEVALNVGFQTQAHFTTVFKKMTGCTPAKWREAKRAEPSHDNASQGFAQAAAG
jgi:AraC family transcriptional regulator